jgi:hypothetical protein
LETTERLKSTGEEDFSMNPAFSSLVISSRMKASKDREYLFRGRFFSFKKSFILMSRRQDGTTVGSGGWSIDYRCEEILVFHYKGSSDWRGNIGQLVC